MDGCNQTIGFSVELFHLFGDATRMRLAALLGHFELTVAELTAILDLAQSRVSTHLGKLREAGILRVRKVGVSTYYSQNDGAMPEQARKVWSLLENEIDDPLLATDRERAEDLVRSRDQKAGWPDSVAGQMERYYSPGRTWEALARGLLGLVHLGDVLDGGSGDGTIAQLLAPRAHSYTCYDRSEKLIAAARQRLAHVDKVRYEIGDLHELRFPDQIFDQVLLFHVLTSTHTPSVVLAECARVLRPNGQLIVVTLDRHRQQGLTAAYHHRHPGFEAAELRRLLEGAGLAVDHCEVTSRERRKPYFQVISAFASRGDGIRNV